MTKEHPQADPLSTKSVAESSRDYGKRLIALLNDAGKKHPFFEAPSSEQRKRPTLPGMQNKFLLSTLRLLPILLFISFLFSFYWDFDGVTYTGNSFYLTFDGLIKIVSVSGLIGFGTNWLAITMLFKPENKHPLLGQGLIPSQKEVIAFRLAQAISTDLINPNIIQKKISESGLISFYRDKSIRYIKSIVDDVEFRSELKQLTTEYIREVVANPDIRASLAKTILNSLEESIKSNKLEQIALQTYLFIRGKEAQSIVEQAIHKLPDNIDRLLEKVDAYVESIPSHLEKQSLEIETVVTDLLYQLINQLDVHHLIEENIRSFEEQRLEKMIKGATNDQLRYIQYLGALLGAVGGLVIWSPLIALVILGGLFLVIWSLDLLLMKLGQKSA